MEDALIIALLLLVATIAVSFTVKHFRGQGGCCGGGGYRVKKKRLSRVKYKKSFFVTGMHCENCKRRVEEIVDEIDGILGHVDLKKGTLTVYYEKEIDDAIFADRLCQIGYPIAPIL